MVLAGAMGLASLIYFQGGPWMLRGQLLYWQYRCMNYSAPADQVVYDSGSMTDSPMIGNIPPNEKFEIAHPWDRFYSLLSPPGFKSKGTLFLHERSSPDGTRYLVAVDFHQLLLADGRSVPYFATRLFEPVTWTQLPQGGASALQSSLASGDEWPVDRRVQIFAGQTDPDDISHFTIQYKLGDRVETIDGWIRKNASPVLEQRRQDRDPTPPSP
jgi:hypothetical protein